MTSCNNYALLTYSQLGRIDRRVITLNNNYLTFFMSHIDFFIGGLYTDTFVPGVKNFPIIYENSLKF